VIGVKVSELLTVSSRDPPTLAACLFGGVAALAAVDPVHQSGPHADVLLKLAHSRTQGDRQRLLMGIADLVEASGQGHSETLSDLFLTLVAQVERDIRAALAERLSEATWAPPALINVLALDEIEIARPIIARSPLLKDQDLIGVLMQATIEHQIEVARRPGVGATVVDVILDRSEPAVLTALACNQTADISEPGFQKLVEASRKIAALRAPLTRHPRLNEALAQQLYAWVGQALRQAIGERFRIDVDELDSAIAAAVRSASTPAPVRSSTPIAVDPERDEMERRLIAKLDSAGQLRPGYLVRAAREGRISLFENALAILGGYSVQDVRKAVTAPAPELLALACASVGIDRAVFPSMLAEIRIRTNGFPQGGHLDSSALRRFDQGPELAGRLFRQLIALPE
jgi:uncharacterized protein (DUF2336 family)